MYTAFTDLFQFAGYFFLAAGTVYHSLAGRGLVCREVFDLKLNENYCFSALLLSLVFLDGFRLRIFRRFYRNRNVIDGHNRDISLLGHFGHVGALGIV
jgi:hypothetical protein